MEIRGETKEPKAGGKELLKRVIRTALLCACLLSVARAEVSLKNGNYFTGYVDMKYSGGFEPKIERVYNSKTAFVGHFGFGWGWEYEVYLEPTPEGGMLVHEYGGGAENYFIPDNLKEADLRQAAERLVAIAVKLKEVEGTSAQENLLDRLKRDREYRETLFRRYRDLKEIPAPEIPLGTTMHSNRFSHQEIRRVAAGYRRDFDNGRVEYFDRNGRLSRVADKNGSYIVLSYDVRNRICLLDNFGRLMTVYLNDSNLVQRVEGQNGRWSAYAYDDQKNLIYSRDADGGVQQYAYDARHNMTKIAYSDGTSMELSYYPREKWENVHTVKDRDGSVTEYSYDLDPKDHGHYSVSVKVSNDTGQPIGRARYEYFNKILPQGEMTTRMITDIDGDVTDTTYQPETGLPIVIVRNGQETRFEYDARGHVTRKETPTEITELEYSATVNKVTLVRRHSKVDPKEQSWSRFEYDSRANLLKAWNGAGQAVSLEYDTAGRIAVMIAGQQRLTFAYNRMQKPEKISLTEAGKEIGTIVVEYDDAGQIKKVDSPSGRKMAFTVTSAFQKLLDIIRPAGVTLSF